MTWPKERPSLSEEQSAIRADWINEFLTEVKPSRFAWLTGFDDRFAPRSFKGNGCTLEIGAGTGSHVPLERDGAYVALENAPDLAAQIPSRPELSVVVADCEAGLPWNDATFDRVITIHLLEHQ